MKKFEKFQGQVVLENCSEKLRKVIAGFMQGLPSKINFESLSKRSVTREAMKGVKYVTKKYCWFFDYPASEEVETDCFIETIDGVVTYSGHQRPADTADVEWEVFVEGDMLVAYPKRKMYGISPIRANFLKSVALLHEPLIHLQYCPNQTLGFVSEAIDYIKNIESGLHALQCNKTEQCA